MLGTRSKRGTLWLIALLGVVYLIARTVWYDTYPPTRDYDHFNTQVTLNVLKDSSLYASDPIWKDGGQVRSLGFLFLGALRIGDKLFGGYVESWTAFYFLHLLIYLPGAFLLFRFLTRHDWLSALLALASSLPYYLYFSYTHWGITSPYATTFTTAQAPWLFLALMHLLRQEQRAYLWWGVFGLFVSSMIFWNPVNGLILVQIIGFVLLIEWLSGRIRWTEFALVVGIMAVALVVYFASTSGSTFSSSLEDPLTETETQTVIDSWKAYVGLHFYPWAATETAAFRSVLAAAIGGVLFVLSAPLMRAGLSRWWLIGLIVLFCQIPIPILMARDSAFLLMAAYWVYRYRRIDRWDVLWLGILTVSNIGGNVQAALGYNLFAEQKFLSAASIAFESLRNTRWAFLVLFVFAGRWCGDLIVHSRRQNGNILSLAAVPFILGSLLSRIGHVGLDDTVIVRPFDEELRLYLPFIAFLLAFTGRVPLLRNARNRNLLMLPLVALASFIALGFAQNLKPTPFDSPSTAMAVVLLLMLVGLVAWLREEKHPRFAWIPAVPLLFMMVIVPISSYSKAHENHNPSDDFMAVAHWARDNTAQDALFVMPEAALDPMPFRAESKRSIMAWDVLQSFFFLGPRAMLDSNTLFFSQIYVMNPAEPEVFRSTAESLGFDYIVVRREYGAVPYPIAFETPNLIIYRVEPM